MRNAAKSLRNIRKNLEVDDITEEIIKLQGLETYLLKS